MARGRKKQVELLEGIVALQQQLSERYEEELDEVRQVNTVISANYEQLLESHDVLYIAFSKALGQLSPHIGLTPEEALKYGAEMLQGIKDERANAPF